MAPPPQERPFYPSMIRTLLKAALATSSSADVKDIETAVVTLRNERLKAEKDRDGKSKKSANKKRFLNAGSGGGAGGDMEDARFYAQSLDTPGAADEYEFVSGPPQPMRARPGVSLAAIFTFAPPLPLPPLRCRCEGRV